MKPNNPFLIAGYAGPEYFCDRENETATLLDALANDRNVTLIAPRRIGKTGLIHHVFQRITETDPDTVALYMDIFSTQTLGDFVRLFAGTILGALDSTPQKALSRISKFIRSCRPVFTIDEFTGAPKVTIDVSPDEEENTLKEVFEYLKSSDKVCYVAIDEFQQIAEYPEKGVEALLRSHIQFLPNVRFIFSGSRWHIMQDMFMSSKRPFYQSTQVLTINTIDKQKYFDFAETHFKNRGLTLPKDVFDIIYEKYEGHTWYIQCLLNRIYGYNRPAVDMDLVAYADGQIVSEYGFAYADLLRSCTPTQTRLLKAIAREGRVKGVLAGSFISRYGLRAASSVDAALKKLIDRELVYSSGTGYIVYDRFFGEWLNR